MYTNTTTLPDAPQLAVSRESGEGITIRALGLDGLVTIGTFAGPADAWSAIDALDLGLKAA